MLKVETKGFFLATAAGGGHQDDLGGPIEEDTFFLLVAEGGGGCAVPASDPSADALMSRLQSLPNFDNDAFIEAMTTIKYDLFVIWQHQR